MPDNARRWRWRLLALFLLAFLVRWYAVTFYTAEPLADPADYHRLAVGLSKGLGFVNEAGAATAWRPPGYPFFLAGIYDIADVSVRAATLVQAALGSFTVLLLTIFGALVVRRREAFAGGLLAAVYPGLFWLPRLLLSENLSLFLLLASLYATVMLTRSRRFWWAVGLGLLLGLSALVRGANLFVAAGLLVGLAVVSWKRSWEWKKILATLLLVVCGIGAALVPWTARNYGVFHRFVLIATQDGITFYASYWPPQRDGKLIWGSLPGEEDPVVAEAAKSGDEVSVSKYLMSASVERLRQNPGFFFRLIPSKLIALVVPLDWETFPHAAGASRSFNPVYVLALIPAMLGVWFLLRRRARDQWLLWVLPGAVLVQAIIFYGSPRFRLPAETSLLLFAGVGLVWMWDFVRSRRDKKQSDSRE